MALGWFARLRAGLGKTSSKIAGAIEGVFRGGRLDDASLGELEDILITADLGVATAAKLSAELAKNRFGKDVSADEVKNALAEQIEKLLAPVAIPLEPAPGVKPYVVLVCGVNGSGKTTTIGKLAKNYSDAGLKVMMAAGDTFRAAAIEQLQVWGERTGTPVVARETGSDAAAVAYDAITRARTEGTDILFVDTAGRLQNKKHLMEELQKVIRVMRKVDESAPHAVLLVLDATVGQNAHSQVETFLGAVNVTGLVMTKLDGSAKGGVVVALAEKFGLPLHAVGVGEQADDLRAFSPRDFARGLMGLD
ncbi:MAG: signal recognition particle-docking protein FtsY [Rhodospirillales bacterium]